VAEVRSRTVTGRRWHRLVLVGALAVAVAVPFATLALESVTFVFVGQPAPGLDPFTIAIGILGITAVSVGVVILWRRPGNLIGAMLLVGALLVTTTFLAWPTAVYRSAVAGPSDIVATAALWWGLNALLIGVFLLFPAVGILFPDGRLPSRRWRLPFAVVVAMLVIATIMQTVAPWPPDSGVVNRLALPGVPAELGALGGGLAALAVFIGAAMAVVAVATRFRRSVGAERAQLKWLVASVSLTAILFPLSYATDVGPAVLIDVLSVAAACLIPIAVGIAILRYRLYDIDRIVSRTISYGAVTALLVTVFVVVNLALQGLLSGVTSNNALAVAGSTLLAAALFTPVRRRVQGAVDRRFDRARYDGERTTAAFSERLRDQVDLPTLADELDRTVRHAISPSSVSLWLRGDGR
jgi:hypothetical protein